MNGHDVKQDKRKALKWFEYAIGRGSINAIYNKGKILIDGGKKEEGMKLIEEAAKKYHYSARRMLGWIESDDSETKE